jgi:antitoxin component HigA of HigAB toxin-antitoxin module
MELHTPNTAQVSGHLTEKLKSKLEQVQRRAARYVTNQYHNTSSVSAMLNHLQLPTLEHLRHLKQNYNAL